MGDACLGITRLRAAASSSHALSPVYTDGPFVADAAVKDLLSERQNVDRALLDPPSRADFKAAKPSGKLSPVMDTTGMAALVCRHEFVAVATNMFTPENFCYYDIMLEHTMKEFRESSGRQLECFFLDIARQISRTLGQLRQRCAEEVQILSREAHDMVEFYTKQQADLQAALHARCAGNAQAGVTHCPAHTIPVLSDATKDLLDQHFNCGLACPCATVLKDGSASTPSSGTGGSTAFAAACVHGPAACEGDPATCGAELAAVRRDLTAIAACGSTELLNLAAGNVISTGTHCWLFPVKASNCFFS
ncbi:TPA: hypothetical protein ACH3X1_012532 [Trebouxia sp. C0004]